MTKEKTLADKIIFIDNLIDSTFSKKTYLYYRDIIEHLNSIHHDRDYFLEEYINQKQEIERLNNIIKEAIEYHNNCIENLDLDKIDDNEKLAYKVAYEIHNNYLGILQGSDKE